MTMKKISQLSSRLSLRTSRLSSVKKPNKNRPLEFFADELEQRQLLASFTYSSGLLTVQTTSNNEQLSIISTSESGNYTITTSGSWSGSASNINISGTSLFVNQPSGLASILMNDNSGAISGSGLSFGTSSANFVSNLTANFTSGSSSISVGNATSFTSGKALSLTSNAIALASNITTAGTQAFTGNVTINGNVSLSSGGSAITVTGTIDSAAQTAGGNVTTSFTSNSTWNVPTGVTQADVLVVGGGGGGGTNIGGGGGGGGAGRLSIKF